MDIEVKCFRTAGFLKTALLLIAALAGLLIFGGGTARAEEATPVYGLYRTDGLVYACDEKGELIDPESSSSIENTSVTNLFVEEDVMKIADKAFMGCRNLKEVRLASTVEEIGEYAFAQSGLETINLQDASNLKIIGKLVFHQCYSLTEITLPSTVEEFGDNIFLRSGLTKVNLPEGLTKLGISMFRGCEDLTTITLPSSIKEIGSTAFSESGLTSIKMPETSKLTGIGSGAFMYCFDLTTITCPDTVEEIGDNAFKRSSLTSIKMPEGLKKIGENAFNECENLTTITLPKGLEVMGDNVFMKSGLESVTVSEGVTVIGNGAFNSCTALKTIDLPKSLEKIGKSAFYDCKALTTITLPEELTDIGDSAFGHTGLETITVPENVTEIGFAAFVSCDALKVAKLPSRLTKIDDVAFALCYSLSRIVLSGATPPEVVKDAFLDMPSTCYVELAGEAASDEASGPYATWCETYGFTKTLDLEKEVNIPSLEAQTYTGQAFEPSINIPGTEGFDYKVAYKDNINAGKATVNITSDGCYGIYSGSTSKTFTIHPASGTAQVGLEGWAYGQAGNSPEPVSATNGTDHVTYEYKTKGAADETYQEAVPAAAGHYTVRATFAAFGNYAAVTATADFTIEKAECAMTIIPESGKEIQAGKPITLNICLKGLKEDKLKGTVAILDKTLTLKDGQASIAYTPADANPVTLTAVYTPADGESYTSTRSSITIVAGKKTREPIIVHDVFKTYGDADFALEPTGGSLQEGEAYTYTSDNEAVATVQDDGTVTITGVGTAHITVSVDGNSVWNQTMASMTLTVSPREGALMIQADKTQYTYGDAITLTVDIGLKTQSRSLFRAAADTVDFYLGDPANGRQLASAAVKNGKATATINKNNPHYPNAGIAEICVIYGGSESAGASSGSIRLNIHPAAGTAKVSLVGWTYGQPENSPVPSSTTNGTANVTYAYKAKAAADDTYQTAVPTAAGQYTVQATFGAFGNYAAVTATADFTIEKAKPVMTITPETGKEIQVGKPITLNIAVKGVKDESPKGTVDILGNILPLEDGQASIDYILADAKPITLTADYTPAEGENYTSAQAKISLEAGKINREPIVVSDMVKTYGDAAFTLTPAGGSLQAGEAYTYKSDNRAVATVKADGTVTITGAGTAHITVSVPGSSAWNPAEAVMTLTVNKAKITGVTFEDATFTEDGKEHKIEVTGQLPKGTAVTYENNVQTAPGVYTAKARIDGGANYESLELSATLTITAKPVDPDQPDTPDKPDEPDTPETPDTPDTPGTPDKPGTPGEGGQPGPAPEAGDTPTHAESALVRSADSESGNIPTGLTQTGSASGAAVLLSLAALTGICAWKKKRKN